MSEIEMVEIPANELRRLQTRYDREIICAECGREIINVDSLFRCGDCEQPFHRQCLRLHFGVHKRSELCSGGCGYQEPYGFVPEADCPVHDSNLHDTFLWNPETSASVIACKRCLYKGELDGLPGVCEDRVTVGEQAEIQRLTRDLAAEKERREAAEAELARERRFICKKCGLRQQLGEKPEVSF